MWINERGALETQYNDTRYPNLESLADWEYPLWLVYNPAQTDFEAMAVYADVVRTYFQHCRRYVETADAVVDMLLAKGILCDLFTDEHPLEISYDGGNRLENIATQVIADELRVSFLWAKILQNEYAFSIQIFVDAEPTGLQHDDVISGTPVHSFSLDIAALPAGDYIVNLIVYDFLTGKSESGIIVKSEARFQRLVEIARFTVEG